LYPGISGLHVRAAGAASVPKLSHKTAGGMANRQIARDLKVAPETINRHIARLGRHCFLFHQVQMNRAELIQIVVVDGYESFELSQYHPSIIMLQLRRKQISSSISPTVNCGGKAEGLQSRNEGGRSWNSYSGDSRQKPSGQA
jgi:hypothetical protein